MFMALNVVHPESEEKERKTEVTVAFVNKEN